MHPALDCPICRVPLTNDGGCRCGRCYPTQNGIIRLLAGAQGRMIRAFAALIAATRHSQHIPTIQPWHYPQLPYGPGGTGHEWRLRRHDHAVVRRLLAQRGPQTILDIGAWNGWLSHQLALDGHSVTAADYFDDAQDGLGARQWYPSNWRAVQCDLLDLAALGTYDVIILNRCLQFFGDPLEYLKLVRAQVRPGGMIILSGLQIFADPRTKAATVQQIQSAHRTRYGFELFLRPCKGFLDLGDARNLCQAGIHLRPYRIPANLRAIIDPTRPLHLYGYAPLRNPQRATCVQDIRCAAYQ
jgi:SAM-dependent methyltransferase